MKQSILLFILTSIIISCGKPCLDASTGPPNFQVEIVDAITNENVFTNGTYTQNQLQITTLNSTSFDYNFYSENNLNIISISPAWDKGTFETTIKLGPDIIIPISTKIKKAETDCYKNYFIETVIISNYENNFDTVNYIHRIKI